MSQGRRNEEAERVDPTEEWPTLDGDDSPAREVFIDEWTRMRFKEIVETDAEEVASLGWAMILRAIDRAKRKPSMTDMQHAALIRWLGKTARDTLDHLHLLAMRVAARNAGRVVDTEEQRARADLQLVIFNQLSAPFLPLVEHAARVNAGQELMAATSAIGDLTNPVLGVL